MLRPVFKSHGGKWFIHKYIINLFPENYTELEYYEGAGGAASVLLNKKKSVSETYNDLDPGIVSIFQEIVHNFDPFMKSVSELDYAENIFKEAKVGEQNALNELVRRRMSRGGLCKEFSWSERQRGGRPGDLNAFETFKKQLPLIADRLKDVQIRCMPVADLVRQFDSEQVLWYIDPPYLPDTRTAKKVYNFEMTEEDHIELAEVLNTAKGKVVLSGYQSLLYAKLYNHWNLSCIPMKNHAGQGKSKQTRIECIWRNY